MIAEKLITRSLWRVWSFAGMRWATMWNCMRMERARSDGGSIFCVRRSKEGPGPYIARVLALRPSLRILLRDKETGLLGDILARLR